MQASTIGILTIFGNALRLIYIVHTLTNETWAPPRMVAISGLRLTPNWIFETRDSVTLRHDQH